MTLKDKMKEVAPDTLDEDYNGGVLGCPFNYHYLNTPKSCCVCAGEFILRKHGDCSKCWNQEYKGD